MFFNPSLSLEETFNPIKEGMELKENMMWVENKSVKKTENELSDPEIKESEALKEKNCFLKKDSRIKTHGNCDYSLKKRKNT